MARWTKVDILSWPDRLEEGARCIYYHTYTPKDETDPTPLYKYSHANQLVLNYKMGPLAVEANPWRGRYREEAIAEYADIMTHLFGDLMSVGGMQASDLGGRAALVPVPPSKPVGAYGYDDRNLLACESVGKWFDYRVCRDIEFSDDIGCSHARGSRNPDEIKRAMYRAEYGANDAEAVFLIDDTLVTGAHFTACSRLLRETGCEGTIIGIFLARSDRDNTV